MHSDQGPLHTSPFLSPVCKGHLSICRCFLKTSFWHQWKLHLSRLLLSNHSLFASLWFISGEMVSYCVGAVKATRCHKHTHWFLHAIRLFSFEPNFEHVEFKHNTLEVKIKTHFMRYFTVIGTGHDCTEQSFQSSQPVWLPFAHFETIVEQNT